MKFWREASTIILALRQQLTRKARQTDILSTLNVAVSSTTQDNSAAVKSSCDYKILMLKRTAGSSFMPSRLVFPGGVLHDVDYSKDWSDVFRKVTGQNLADVAEQLCSKNAGRPPIMTTNREWSVSSEIAFRICAVREMFEESGLLIATRHGDVPLRDRTSATLCTAADLTLADDEWRKKVDENPQNFLNMCMELGVVPNVWSLNEWKNWLTPVFNTVTGPSKKPRRFDTMFYMCCLDVDKIPQTFADKSETTHAEWRSPKEYMKIEMAGNSDHTPLAPPQAYELNNLSTISDLETLLKECKRRAETGVRCWMPIWMHCSDAVMILLPGDYMYPKNPDYEGMKDMTGPLSCPLSEISDTSKSLHRITFDKIELVKKLEINSASEHPVPVDNLLQNGIITCNVEHY